MEEARLFRSMPLVHRAFKNLAGHAPGPRVSICLPTKPKGLEPTKTEGFGLTRYAISHKCWKGQVSGIGAGLISSQQGATHAL